MGQNKPPAFQLYAADLLVDTAEWSNTEVGIYLRLLFFEWVNNDLPSDLGRLASMVAEPLGEFQKAWDAVVSQKFIVNGNGRLINVRLEETRKEQNEYRKKQIEAGKRGAAIRWKDRAPTGDPTGTTIDDPNGEQHGNRHGQNIALHLHPSSPSSDSEKIAHLKKDTCASFDDFWKVWPKKVAKEDAIKAWKKIKPDKGKLEMMVAAVAEQKQSEEWTKDNGQFIPHPASWLNGKRWKDQGVSDLATEQKKAELASLRKAAEEHHDRY